MSLFRPNKKVPKPQRTARAAGKGPRSRKSFPRAKPRQPGDPPTGEHPFDALSIRNIDPNESPGSLLYIGSLFEERLHDEGFDSLQEIIDYVANHRRAENTRLFERVFVNETWEYAQQQNEPNLKCKGASDWRSGRPGFQYAVRRYNYYGWNALRQYLILRLLPEEREMISNRGVRSDRVPAAQTARGPMAAFPAYCAVPAP